MRLHLKRPDLRHVNTGGFLVEQIWTWSVLEDSNTCANVSFRAYAIALLYQGDPGKDAALHKA